MSESALADQKAAEARNAELDAALAGAGQSPESVQDARLLKQREVLTALGERVRGKVLEVTSRLTGVNDFCKEIARDSLEARLTIIKQLPKSKLWVHDWDGRSGAYQEWYAEYVTRALEANAPSESFTMAKDDGSEEVVVISDVNWIRNTQRSIQHYVEEYRPGFMTAHGYAEEATKFDPPLSMVTKTERNRAAYLKRKEEAEKRSKKSGTQLATERIEDILESNEDNGVVLTNGMLLTSRSAVSYLTVETIGAMNKTDRKKLLGTVSKVQAELDKIVNAFAEVERIEEQGGSASSAAA